MKVIIIEDAVYKVTERDFQRIKTAESEMDGIELMEFLDTIKPKFKHIGLIEFDFRL